MGLVSTFTSYGPRWSSSREICLEFVNHQVLERGSLPLDDTGASLWMISLKLDTENNLASGFLSSDSEDWLKFKLHKT